MWDNWGGPGALVTPIRDLTPNREGLAMKATPCSYDGCTKFAAAKGLCRTHYSRVQRTGSVETTRKKRPKAVAAPRVPSPPTPKFCSVPGCDAQVPKLIGGMCPKHYNRLREHGSTDAPPTRRRFELADTCCIDGCEKPPYPNQRGASRGMCSMHIARVRRHGSTDIPERVYVPRPKKPKDACSIEGCERPVKSWGWCELHYKRWKRTGDPLWVDPKLGTFIELVSDPTMARFWSKVEIADCWEWMAGKTTAGYGEFCKNNKGVYAHRQAYEWLVGPIPAGLVLDHICRNPPCVNPDHLRVVTTAFNTAVGYSPAAIRARTKRAKGVAA